MPVLIRTIAASLNIRMDKKARTTGVFHVALCKQSYADTPGAEAACNQGGGVRQKSTAEIKSAIESLAVRPVLAC